MRTRRIGLLVLVLTAGIACLAMAMDISEVGVRIDLALQPFRVGSAIHWDFVVGGYTLVRFNEGWGARASAGYDVLNVGPYLSLGLARTVVESVLLEGDVTFQWNFLKRSSVASLDAGVRFISGPRSAQHTSLAIFPTSWTLNMATGQPTSFSFSPSFTAEGALVLETGLLVGEAVSVTFLRVPSLADQPVLALGGGWMLATCLTTRIGYAPPTP
jgi:hypothetical protein